MKTDAFTPDDWDVFERNGRKFARGVNEKGTNISKPQYDHRHYTDATTVMVQPDGRPRPVDDLDELITEMYEQMTRFGTDVYHGHILISEERDMSVSEIQQDFRDQIDVND